MKRRGIFLLACFLLLTAMAGADAKESIRLANNPALSPDGSTLAFDWNGDIWTVPVAGGEAKPLTQHTARDREPKFSPDGKEIAFISDRDGSPQVYVMPAQGGTPKQLTFHTAGYSLQGWTPDGKSLLVHGSRDHFWRHANRFFTIARVERGPEQMLFDDYGNEGVLSPDGKRLLFVREGPAWWRKGYHGSQAAQIWLHDLDRKSFARAVDDDFGARWPLWKSDGKGFYHVSGKGGSFNLWERDLESGKNQQITQFKDDSVVFPCISRDGSTVVFRHLFDFYSLKTGSGNKPVKIDIFHNGDRVTERKERRLLTSATQVAFSADGLEIAFIAGGDLWVMDTELREPRQITSSPEEESQPIFSPDGESIYFVSDMKGQSDIWKAERADKQKYWYLNDKFNVTRLTEDGEVKSALRFSPDGSKLSYLRSRGDLYVAGPDCKDAKRVLESWNPPQYDWSPDGKWLVYSLFDNDFNQDIWLMPADGSKKPFNLSRHPYNDGNPVWSPDGKVVAFTGKRGGAEGDIYFVWLRDEDEEKNQRDRTLEKALDKINKARKPSKPGAKDGDGEPVVKKGMTPEVVLDLDKIHERIRRVGLNDATVSNLFWSYDSKKLAFTASIDGRRGIYTIDITADNPRPTLLTTQTVSQPRWLQKGLQAEPGRPSAGQIVGLANGLPTSIPGSGTGATTATAPTTPTAPTSPRRGGGGAPSTDSGASTGGGTAYRFQARQEVDLAKKYEAAFDLAWRTMRDRYYDEHLGKRNWNEIRAKYKEIAGQSPDTETLGTVVNLMLGELNGSHLGFTPTGGGAAGRFGRPGTPPPATPGAPEPETGGQWTVTTAHLGVRFDPNHKGTGLKVKDVIPGSPADQKKGRVLPGELILSIDGKDVNPAMDLTTVLNGAAARDIRLAVRNAEGKDREVTLRPISYTEARRLLYDKWVKDNRKLVEDASKGTLGYLHISAMSMPSFHKFEEELYSAGAGKDGLIIDVRENGGGSTTDHLLTALTQPVHAITVPRGGGPGYPQDRKIYATWNKPIIVLCNQNSFSNAEIFSHAIKTLKRGQLVGVPTAGGVISTGGTSIMDVGFLRLPGRGWYVLDTGLDMELNGAVPHHVVWPEPGQMTQGKDVQIDKAVDVLLADVKEWKNRPQPILRKAMER